MHCARKHTPSVAGPINSVDIHTQLARFATAGADNTVKIWSFEPLRKDLGDGADGDAPKLLCTLARHLGPVNCVRWASHGSLLASAGDDTTVILYELSDANSYVKPFGAVASVEPWGTRGVLRAHTMDVTSLAWAPSVGGRPNRHCLE
jgi:WD40 repeat protein